MLTLNPILRRTVVRPDLKKMSFLTATVSRVADMSELVRRLLRKNEELEEDLDQRDAVISRLDSEVIYLTEQLKESELYAGNKDIVASLQSKVAYLEKENADLHKELSQVDILTKDVLHNYQAQGFSQSRRPNLQPFETSSDRFRFDDQDLKHGLVTEGTYVGYTSRPEKPRRPQVVLKSELTSKQETRIKGKERRREHPNPPLDKNLESKRKEELKLLQTREPEDLKDKRKQGLGSLFSEKSSRGFK